MNMKEHFLKEEKQYPVNCLSKRIIKRFHVSKMKSFCLIEDYIRFLAMLKNLHDLDDDNYVEEEEQYGLH